MGNKEIWGKRSLIISTNKGKYGQAQLCSQQQEGRRQTALQLLCHLPSDVALRDEGSGHGGGGPRLDLAI